MEALRISLRSATVWGIIAATALGGLLFIQDQRLSRFAEENQTLVGSIHNDVTKVFQSSFFFQYGTAFFPTLERKMTENPVWTETYILDNEGRILFNSKDPGAMDRKTIQDSDLLASLSKSKRLVKQSYFKVIYSIPEAQYTFVYVLSAHSLRWRGIAEFALVIAGMVFLATAGGRLRRSQRILRIGVRGKFVLIILAVNFLGGLVLYLRLTATQSEEIKERIEREFQLFSQFTTSKVITDFSESFHFYYDDRFEPAMKSVLASNENLEALRIISAKDKNVLYASDLERPEKFAPGLTPFGESELSESDLSLLAERGVLFKGSRVYVAYRPESQTESQDPLYIVGFYFHWQQLEKAERFIRQEILKDLLFPIAIGILIAFWFGGWLVAPIRRLKIALQKVKEGQFETELEIRSRDEMGDLLEAFNQMSLELKKRRELQKFLSDSTYRKVMETMDTSSGETRIKGIRTQATVLFSDIRNFVNHCDLMDAEEVTTFLNDYFNEMVDVIYKNGGEVDKFIGDGILAVFYSENEHRSGSPMQALLCALEMMGRLEGINDKRKEKGKQPLQIGIGLAHGEVISGPIGSKDRRDFTVIGDVVNVASRIEKLSKDGKFTRILFNGEVENHVRDLIDAEKLENAEIRGKNEKVDVYELKAIKNLDALLGQLSSHDPKIKLRSIELLGRAQNQSAIPPLITLLEDSNEDVRVQAALSLAFLSAPNDDKSVRPLLDRLKKEKDPKVQSALISCVGKLCSSELIFELSEYLEVSDDRIVANAVEAMGRVRDARIEDLLLPKLSSLNNRVKANAAIALFAAGRTAVIDSLKPMLMHSDPLMRSSAAFAIGELTTSLKDDKDHSSQLLRYLKENPAEAKHTLAELQESVPMLVSLLKDKEPMVKRQAIVALGKIRDKSAVLPLIDNIEFPSESKDVLQDVAAALRAIGSHRLVREILDRLG